jgi:acetyl-CoA carboxylase biotin carboxyl carrier protein
MDIDELKELVIFMNENDLVELEVESSGKKVRLRKSEGKITLANPGEGLLKELSQKAPSKPAPKQEELIKFKSPLVGTFYRAPKPDAEPYVEVGDEVTPEKVICIIEAMKIMNEIKAEVNGIIKEICVRNGQAVEYGEILFIIAKTESPSEAS